MPSRSIRLNLCSSTRFLRGTVTLSAAARFSSRRATRSVHPEISRQCCPGVYRKRSGLSRYVQSAEETARIGKARKADRNHFFMGSVLRGYDHSSKRSRQTTNTKEPYCRPGYSPPRRGHQHTCPRRGGVAAPLIKCCEASEAAQTGWSLTNHVSNALRNVTCKRPPRPCHFGTDSFS